MGCFNTKGFFSGLDIVGGEKAFVLVCVQYHPPLTFDNPELGKRCHEFDHNSGVMYPITFPIFGEYNDYGGIENIQKDFNVQHLESLLGDTVENFLEILEDVSFPRYLEQKDIDKYNSYKRIILDKICKKKSDEEIEEIWRKYDLKRRYTLEEWKEFSRKMEDSDNMELTWTMDYAWVYDTLGTLYYSDFEKNYETQKKRIFGNGSTSVLSKFGLVWGEDSEDNPVYEYEMEIRKYLSFTQYLRDNFSVISHSQPTGQDVEWDKIHKYLSEKVKFIENTFKDYL